MKKILNILFLLVFLSTLSTTQAQEQTPSENLALPQDEAVDQNTWTTTKLDPSTQGVVRFSASDSTTNESFVEIVTTSSIAASRSNPSLSTSNVVFKAKHNKVGLFYIYAQTSDNGGQLLFSIQMTEASGILLEESDRQITLVPDYEVDRWYDFSITLNSTAGAQGTFTIAIDGEPLGEYQYVKSESTIFDLAQITIGAESTGQKSVSGFTDPFSVAVSATTTLTSDALLQLSISLSSSSISSSLDNGLIVTASLDGIMSIATSSIQASSTDISSTTEVAISTSTDTEEDSSLGSFIVDIVEAVIDIFVPEEATTTEPVLIPPIETEPTPVLPIEESASDTPMPEDTVQSSLSTVEVPQNETTTTEF